MNINGAIFIRPDVAWFKVNTHTPATWFLLYSIVENQFFSSSYESQTDFCECALFSLTTVNIAQCCTIKL